MKVMSDESKIAIQHRAQVFKNDILGVSMRGVSDDEINGLIAKDVADALQYKDTDQAIRRHCRHANTYPVETRGQVRYVKVIPQSDVLRLIMRSDMPRAEEFQDWVMEDVLPSILNHGVYATDKVIEKTIEDPDYIIGILKALKREREQKNILEMSNRKLIYQRAEDLPKIRFSEAVMESDTAMSMEAVAKVLNFSGIGRNRLFAILRGKNILMSGRGNKNRPYQKYIDRGYFKCVETKYTITNGETKVGVKPVVFQKGVKFIKELLEKDNE